MAGRVLGRGRPHRPRRGPGPARAARDRREDRAERTGRAAHHATAATLGRLRGHPPQHRRLHDLVQLPGGVPDRRHRHPRRLGARDPRAVRRRRLHRPLHRRPDRRSAAHPRAAGRSDRDSGRLGAARGPRPVRVGRRTPRPGARDRRIRTEPGHLRAGVHHRVGGADARRGHHRLRVPARHQPRPRARRGRPERGRRHHVRRVDWGRGWRRSRCRPFCSTGRSHAVGRSRHTDPGVLTAFTHKVRRPGRVPGRTVRGPGAERATSAEAS